MKKSILLNGTILLVAIVLTSFLCMGSDENSKAVSNQVPTAEIKIEAAKVLVAYFTWPEPDGVDASSGASRIISDGKLYGNTEYVARLIAKETKGDLFAIQTEKKISDSAQGFD